MKPLNTTGSGGRGEIWAIASGKGGTGKSFLTTSLGLSLAKMGKRVILVDGDLGCANLHTCLGMNGVDESLSDFISGRVDSIADIVLQTPHANLSLISGAQDILDVANPTHARKTALLKAVKELDYDYLLLDLGAGTAYNTLDFFLTAHKGILMVMPEPTAIENAYRFIKSAYYRYIKLVSRELKIRQLVEESMDLKNELGVYSVHDLVGRVAQFDPEIGKRLKSELMSMRPRLVVNHVRTLDDVTLGFSMRSSVEKYFGLRMDYTGYVEYDDVVWQSARKRKPVVTEYPYSSPARCVERIMRNLMEDTQLELESFTARR
ncbi:MAG: AAA family ATPase [Leptospirillia bacterium]